MSGKIILNEEAEGEVPFGLTVEESDLHEA